MPIPPKAGIQFNQELDSCSRRRDDFLTFYANINFPNRIFLNSERNESPRKAFYPILHAKNIHPKRPENILPFSIERIFKNHLEG